MPYFFFMKHPMCLSVWREGRGRRRKGTTETARAASSSLHAESLSPWALGTGSWGTREQPWGPGWPQGCQRARPIGPVPELACGFPWELLSTDHLRLSELSLKVIPSRDASTGEVNWLDGPCPDANSGAWHCGCSLHNSIPGWIISNVPKAVATPKEDSTLTKPEGETLRDSPLLPPPPAEAAQECLHGGGGAALQPPLCPQPGGTRRLAANLLQREKQPLRQAG